MLSALPVLLSLFDMIDNTSRLIVAHEAELILGITVCKYYIWIVD